MKHWRISADEMLWATAWALFYGPVERAVGDFQPAPRSYLEEVFTNGRYAVYEVNLGH